MNGRRLRPRSGVRRGLGRAIIATCLVAALAAPLRAAVPADAAAAAAHGRALLEADDPAAALEFLREAARTHDDAAELKHLLALAYIKQDNLFWAIRTLEGHTSRAPDDCAARALLAVVYVQQAALGPALGVLERPGCAAATADHTRLRLIEAWVQHLRGDAPAARAAAWAARAADEVYASDRPALAALFRLAVPEALADLAFRVELAGGGTSNALMSSPAEQVSAADPASGLFQVDAFVRFTPAVHRVVRPAAELQLKVFRLLSEDAKDLSYFQVTGRLGALLGGALPRVLLAYRPELVVLDRDYGYDRGPIVFYEAHRGEVEVEVAPWLIAFAGGGRRVFSDMARSRYEVDLGLGGQIPLPVSFLNVLWAASGRMFRAHEPAYHQWGASALLAVQFRLPAGFLARLSGGVTVDIYPDSAGFRVFFPQGGGGHRRDVQGRFGATLWSPALWGVRLGASYEFAERDSTADPFGFRDHRGLVRLAWSGEVDVTLPRTAATAAPLALPWGFDAAGVGFDDRVQDMLRQDEQVQRSSSCVQ